MTNLRNLTIIAGLAVSVSACAAATQPRETARVSGLRCASLEGSERQVAELLRPGNVSKVEALQHEVNYYGDVQPLYIAGAKLYVPAEPGLSEAYLARALSCHAAQTASGVQHPNDPLRVAGVHRVDVRSSGQTFEIAIIGVDRDAGEAIWQRTQALRDASTQIQVEQLGSAASSASL